MQSLRYLVLLTFEFVRRFKVLIIVGFLLGVILFLAIRFLSVVIPIRSVQKIGVTGRFQSDNLPDFILNKISLGLTVVDESGLTNPALARSWETPDKGKTWTFKLAGSHLWQDMAKVTSQSVVYEFNEVEITKPDSETITFSLNEPYAPFPLVVSKPTFKQGLLGMGEWKVDDITLAGNFFSKLSLVNSDKETIIYKFYPTVDRTKLALKLGEVDQIVYIQNPSPFGGWQTVEIDSWVDENQVVAVFFNTQDKLLSEKSVRQALYYAIDKNQLGERAFSPISPNSWAYNPQVKKYPHDSERSMELVGELPEELQKTPIKLVSTPTLLEVAEKIALDWKSAGITTTVQVSSVVPSEFQAFLTTLDIPKDPDQYSLWHSTQTATNVSKYTNPRIDKLLEDGRTTLDIEERKKFYLDFQRFLLEDVPAAFLYHPTYYTVTRK